MRSALDDVLRGYVTELEQTRKKICEMSEEGKEDVYLGRETGRVVGGVMTVTFPEYIPDARSLSFSVSGDIVSFYNDEPGQHTALARENEKTNLFDCSVRLSDTHRLIKDFSAE